MYGDGWLDKRVLLEELVSGVASPDSYKDCSFRVVPKYNNRAKMTLSELPVDTSSEKIAHLRVQAQHEADMNRRQMKKLYGEPVRYGQVSPQYCLPPPKLSSNLPFEFTNLVIRI